MIFYFVSLLCSCVFVCIHTYTHMSIYMCVCMSAVPQFLCIQLHFPQILYVCVCVFYICVCVFGCGWPFAVRGLSLFAVCRGYSLLQRVVFSLQWLLVLGSTGFRHMGCTSCSMGVQQLQLVGSRVWAQQLSHPGYSCSVACGILLERGSNPHPLHWQVDSKPLPPGSPKLYFK